MTSLLPSHTEQMTVGPRSAACLPQGCGPEAGSKDFPKIKRFGPVLVPGWFLTLCGTLGWSQYFQFTTENRACIRCSLILEKKTMFEGSDSLLVCIFF